MEGIEILRPRPFAGGTGDHPPSGSHVPVCKILASPSSQLMLHPGSFEIAAVRGTIRILDRRDDAHRGRHAGVAGGAGLFQAVVAIVHFCTCSAARMTWLQPAHSLAAVFFFPFLSFATGLRGIQGPCRTWSFSVAGYRANNALAAGLPGSLAHSQDVAGQRLQGKGGADKRTSCPCRSSFPRYIIATASIPSPSPSHLDSQSQ